MTTQSTNLYFTTDGTTPTAQSQPVTGPIEVTSAIAANVTVQVVQINPGEAPSTPAKLVISFLAVSPTPSLSASATSAPVGSTVTITATAN